jgi:hypothetical protein
MAEHDKARRIAGSWRLYVVPNNEGTLHTLFWQG